MGLIRVKTLKVSVFLLIFSWFKGGASEKPVPTANILDVYRRVRWICGFNEFDGLLDLVRRKIVIVRHCKYRQKTINYTFKISYKNRMMHKSGRNVVFMLAILTANSSMVLLGF